MNENIQQPDSKYAIIVITNELLAIDIFRYPLLSSSSIDLPLNYLNYNDYNDETFRYKLP